MWLWIALAGCVAGWAWTYLRLKEDLKKGLGVVSHGRMEILDTTPPQARNRLAEEAGFRVTSPHNAAQRGGTITIAAEHAAAMTKELIRREFIVDYRPGAGIRISPHFYTKDEELELIISEMKTIRDTRAYAEHETADAAF